MPAERGQHWGVPAGLPEDFGSKLRTIHRSVTTAARAASLTPGWGGETQGGLPCE